MKIRLLTLCAAAAALLLPSCVPLQPEPHWPPSPPPVHHRTIPWGDQWTRNGSLP
jgi:hypothetical protein